MCHNYSCQLSKVFGTYQFRTSGPISNNSAMCDYVVLDKYLCGCSTVRVIRHYKALGAHHLQG